MVIRTKNGQLEITTNVFQAKNGGIFINWGNEVIKLDKSKAEEIAYDIPDFNKDDFNKFYK